MTGLFYREAIACAENRRDQDVEQRVQLNPQPSCECAAVWRWLINSVRV